MRTLELLQSFSDKEIAEIDTLVESKERKSLKALYMALKKYRHRKSEPETPDLFAAAFGKKYIVKSDYLLRNELRLLNNILYEYLALKTFADYVKGNPSTFNVWLSRGLYVRKLKNLFESDIDKFISIAKADILPANTAAFYRQKLVWSRNKQKETAANRKASEKILEDWKKEIIRGAKYNMRELEFWEEMLIYNDRYATNKVLETPEDGRTAPIGHLDFGPVDEDDIFDRYMVLRKHSFQTRGPVRIDVLKQMMEILDAGKFYNEYTFYDRVGTAHNLAVEFANAGQVEEADKYFTHARAICEKNGNPLIMALIHGNLEIQFHVQRYEKGLELFKAYEKEILAGQSATLLSIFRCCFYLFLRRPEDAIMHLPGGAKSSELEHLLARMVYLMAFIIRGQTDLALNECANIHRMLKATKGDYVNDYLLINAQYKKYLQAQLKPRDESKKELSALQQQLAEQIVAKAGMLPEIPLLWLAKELATDQPHRVAKPLLQKVRA
jgi:hypothetical protein